MPVATATCYASPMGAVVAVAVGTTATRRLQLAQHLDLTAALHAVLRFVAA